MNPPLTAELCPDHDCPMSPLSVWYDQTSCRTFDTWVCTQCRAEGLNGLYLLPRKLYVRTSKLERGRQDP